MSGRAMGGSKQSKEVKVGGAETKKREGEPPDVQKIEKGIELCGRKDGVNCVRDAAERSLKYWCENSCLGSRVCTRVERVECISSFRQTNEL